MNFKMTSYADNFEDVLIRRAFPGVDSGFYIDVGAYDPVDHSVTKHFYDSGWSGINIEPNPTPFARLAAGRPRDINLKIGVSSHEGQLTVYDAPAACWSADRDVMTGFFGVDPGSLVERSIGVTTLAKVCEQYVPDGITIDFLKIDVEGHEKDVIQGGDWARWRPRIVLAEANGVEGWEPTLLAANYIFAIFDGVNRLYVREEDRQLIPRVTVPVNVSDCFLIYGYARRINELQESLNGFKDVGPTAIRIAHQLGRASRKYPRASSLAKKIVRRLTG